MEESRATRWAAISGRWKFSGQKATYLGPDDPEVHTPLGVAVTNFRLTEGKITCRVKLNDHTHEGRILLNYRSFDKRYVTAGIGGWKRAYTVGEYDPALGWRGLATAGLAENLIPTRWYTQTIELTGQRIRISVDGVRVLQHVLDRPPTSGQLGLFAFGVRKIEFENFIVERRRGPYLW